jgi:hypothetical protein
METLNFNGIHFNIYVYHNHNIEWKVLMEL